jgi:uncharacterized protein DUF4238
LARHHLAHFAAADGLLHVYDRERSWSHRRDIPERLAMERFLYAPGASDETGRDPKDDSVERWLADEIDTPAFAPLGKVAAGAAIGDLTPDEIHALANFFAVLDMRTPRVRDHLVPLFAQTAEEARHDHDHTRRALRQKGLKTSARECGAPLRSIRSG